MVRGALHGPALDQPGRVEVGSAEAGVEVPAGVGARPLAQLDHRTRTHSATTISTLSTATAPTASRSQDPDGRGRGATTGPGPVRVAVAVIRYSEVEGCCSPTLAGQP
jgi:hypothetical protein